MYLNIVLFFLADLLISTETIKRIIKKLCMSWHRMRRGVGGKPDPIEYKEKKQNLSELKQLEDEKKMIYTIWMNPDFVAYLVSLMMAKYG